METTGGLTAARLNPVKPTNGGVQCYANSAFF